MLETIDLTKALDRETYVLELTRRQIQLAPGRALTGVRAATSIRTPARIDRGSPVAYSRSNPAPAAAALIPQSIS